MAMDYFLKIDGVAGESTDARHPGEIDVDAWSWGESQAAATGTAGGTTGGKVSMQPLQIHTRFSKATPPLLLACAQGQRLARAVLAGRRASASNLDFLTMTLTDVSVAAVSTGGSEGEDALMTQVSLNYGKIVVEYKEQRPDGSLGPVSRFGWDVAQNVKL